MSALTQTRRVATAAALGRKRRARLAATALAGWRAVASSSALALRGAEHRARSHAARVLLQRAMRGWVTYWARQASVRVLLSHRAAATARACLEAWRDIAAAVAEHAAMEVAQGSAPQTLPHVHPQHPHPGQPGAWTPRQALPLPYAQRTPAPAQPWRQQPLGAPAYGSPLPVAAAAAAARPQHVQPRQPQPPPLSPMPSAEARVQEAWEDDYGRDVHRLLRLRHCFRCWLALADRGMQVRGARRC